jgi:hypothetical protein
MVPAWNGYSVANWEGGTLVVDDRKVFTRPWTVSLHIKPLLDTEMIDFMCQENNKDIGHFVH